MLEIKEIWGSSKGAENPTFLYDRYDDLLKDGHLRIVIRRIENLLRSDTSVTLNGRSASFEEALCLDKASMFNTLVAFCLHHLDAFIYTPGNVLVTPDSIMLDEKVKVFDQVVVRHGANIQKTYMDAGCSEVKDVFNSPDKIRNYLNTAKRLWPAGWWDEGANLEPVSMPTVTLATTFVSTLRDIIELSFHNFQSSEIIPDLQFRMTFHRLIEIQGKFYFQQIARYAGTPKRLEGLVGRVFSVEYGLGGLCCRLGKPVVIEKGPGLDQLISDLETIDLEAQPIANIVESFLAVPFFGSRSDNEPGSLPVIGLLYADSNKKDFFSERILKTIYIACRGFVKNIEEMQRQKEISFSRSSSGGFARSLSPHDAQLFETHAAILDAENAIFREYENDLTFKSAKIFDVSEHPRFW